MMHMKIEATMLNLGSGHVAFLFETVDPGQVFSSVASAEGHLS
jgi:hypothetical protein